MALRVKPSRPFHASMLLLPLAAMLLSGCVAAILPIAAAGVIGKQQIDRGRARKAMVATGAVTLSDTGENSDDRANSAAIASAPSAGAAAYTGVGGGDIDAAGSQYLSRFFTPVEDGIESPFTGFAAHALRAAQRLETGEPVDSMVLAPDFRIESPQSVACAGKPLAVLIDLDPAGSANWLAHDRLVRRDSLVPAIGAIRAAGIAVIWLSDQPLSNAATIRALLADAGLSSDSKDEFLFLGRGGSDRKQIRRWDAAAAYCIVAIAGDKRSDFDELYDYLRDPDGAVTLENRFDKGWFLTPPPLEIAAGDGGEASDPAP